jgi:hypothetical protein
LRDSAHVALLTQNDTVTTSELLDCRGTTKSPLAMTATTTTKWKTTPMDFAHVASLTHNDRHASAHRVGLRPNPKGEMASHEIAGKGRSPRPQMTDDIFAMPLN